MKELYDNLIKNELIFPKNVGKKERNISMNMETLIRRMLAIKEKERPLVDDILQMKEFQSILYGNILDEIKKNLADDQ